MSKEKEIKVASSEEEEILPDETADGSEAPSDSETQESRQDEAPSSKEPTAEEKIAALEDKLLRTMADFENYKRRTAQQYEQMIQSANDRLLLDLLEVVDNFERALQHAGESNEPESLRKGTELIYNQMTTLLERYKLKPIEAVGQPFDPNIHDAMMQTPSDDYDEGLVAMEIAKGYRIGERILRHSRVAVSTGPSTDGRKSDESE